MGGRPFELRAHDLLLSRDSSQTLAVPTDDLCGCIAGSLPRRLLLQARISTVSRLSNSIAVSRDQHRVPNRAGQFRSERRHWTIGTLPALRPYVRGQDSTRCTAKLSTDA